MIIIIIGVLAVITALTIMFILRKPEPVLDLLVEPDIVDDSDFLNFSDKGHYSKKALLIGINEYPEHGRLYGCLNDVFDLLRYFMYTLNISPLPPVPKTVTKENIYSLAQTLRNAGVQVMVLLDSQATSANYRKAADWLYRDTRNGDWRFRAYSGHGTPTPALKGDEADGLNETLAMYDFDWDNPTTWITDDEWWKPVQSLPDGVNDITWFDCCHPDSDMKSIKRSTIRSKTIPVPAIVRNRYAKAYEGGKNRGLRDLPDGVLVLAGARADQTSADATFEIDGKNRKNGAFTKSVLLQLYRNKTATAVDVVTGAGLWLKQQGFEQQPQITTSSMQRKYKPVIEL